MPINNLTEDGYGMLVGSGGGGTDADAQAFITAAGITGATQQAALNQLVLDLKGTGSTTNNTDVWGKCYAVYPFCPIDGSTATLAAYKFNLKDPRDLDAAFRLTFFKSPTASVSLGLNSNATPNSYAETHFVENANMTAGNNGSTFLITRFNTSVLGYWAGSTIEFCSRNTFLNFFQYSANITVGKGSFAEVDHVYTSSRRSATDFEFYDNGISYATSATSSSIQTSEQYRLFCRFSGSPTQFQDGALGFHALHDGLTDNESRDIYDAISTYKTAIGR